MTENQQPIPLIKCLYNTSTSTSTNTLRISDKCFNAYAEMYGKELDYDGKSFSIDKKLITLVEEFGFLNCGGYATHLAFQLVPEELKEYIDVGFVEGTKKVNINYDKAYADILHKQLNVFENEDMAHWQQICLIYKQYDRIKYIKEKYDEVMTQTIDKAYEYPFVYITCKK